MLDCYANHKWRNSLVTWARCQWHRMVQRLRNMRWGFRCCMHFVRSLEHVSPHHVSKKSFRTEECHLVTSFHYFHVFLGISNICSSRISLQHNYHLVLQQCGNGANTVYNYNDTLLLPAAKDVSSCGHQIVTQQIPTASWAAHEHLCSAENWIVSFVLGEVTPNPTTSQQLW